MTRYLLDTNMVSRLIRDPHGRAAERIWEASTQSCTSIVVLAEIRFGLCKNPSPRREQLLNVVIGSIAVEPWDSPADMEYGRLRTALESAGTPIGGNDMLIAAHALALNCVLVTANEREFRRVPGLAVENWAA